MNILMYSTFFPPHYSGAAKQGIALAKRLRARGHHIEFVTIRRNSEDFSGEFDGFKVWRIREGRGKHRELLFWWSFLLFAWSRRKDFQLIHSHGAGYYNSCVGPLGWMMGWKSLVKSSMANNDLLGLGESLSGKIHHAWLKMVDCCVAISLDLVTEFRKYGFPEKQIVYVPNGVDINRFSPVGGAEKLLKREGYAVSAGQKIALTIGVFGPRKNIDWLVRVWVERQGFQTGAQLLVVGTQNREDKDGSYYRNIKAMSEQYPDLVRIESYTERIEDYYQIADYFILPSANEGMPNVLLEAMSSGLPCLCTQVSGCEDLMVEGARGFFFPPNDVDGLRCALNKLCEADIKNLGANARNFIETNFALDLITDRYEQIYDQLMLQENG